MKTTHRPNKTVSAEAIATLAEGGEDVSRYFTGRGIMKPPVVTQAQAVQRVNVDFAAGMLDELDNAAGELNISRQAVIKTLVRQGLDQRYTARAANRAVSRSHSARKS